MTAPPPQLDRPGPTRDALQAWSRVLSAVRRASTSAHPHWWHISLRVTPRGLSTGTLALPGGRTLELELDLHAHRLTVDGSEGEPEALDLRPAPSAARLGERLRERLAARSFAIETDPALWRDESRHAYEPAEAERLHAAFRFAADAFERVRVELPGDRGPVQLWPHHFDLSFEWFGSLRVPSEEGEGEASRAQIGFGLSTGDEGHEAPYFYANPWPFRDELRAETLPTGARWHSGSWTGSLLPWEEVARRGEGLLTRYLRAVYAAASPLLSE